MFARFGVPREIVSDNGLQFTSEDFKHFMAANGIKHIHSSRYHPASNGAAERFVQTVKRAIRAGCNHGQSLEEALSTFLLGFRTTPHATTGVAPCTLMFNRDLRTRLHLLIPDVSAHVRDQQAKQKLYHDGCSHRREFCIGQSVWARNFRGGSPWLKALVFDKLGPVTYLVELENGDYWKRHIDHLRGGSLSCPSESQREGTMQDYPASVTPSEDKYGEVADSTVSTSSNHSEPVESNQPGSVSPSVPISDTAKQPQTPRYSKRSRKPPDRLYGTLRT